MTLNRRRFAISNTPGTAGNLTVGAGVSPSLGLDASHDGMVMAVSIAEGSSWEVRRACTYTHSTTELTRGTLEDSSSGSAINFTSAAVVTVVATAAQMGAGHLVEVPFATAVRFDLQRQMAQTTISGALAFTVNSARAIDGGMTQVDLIADGTNSPTFSSDFREWGGSMGYDNRSGIRNCLTMWRRSGVYWYSWTQAIGATAEPTPATAVTLSGPSSGVVGVASANFTVGANGAITGTVVVTPSDGGGGGTFTPTTVSINTGSPTGTFTYTPGSTGAKTISVTNNGGLSNPSNITYTSNPAATVPGAPTIGTATAGDASASVTFTAPGSDGGSAITGYTVTSSPGGFTGTGASSPITVSGLSNGTAYTFTVTATNAIGTGAASAASNSVTPATSLAVLRVTTLSQITESGDGTAGWNYAVTNGWAASYGVSTPKIPAGSNGSVRVTVGHVIGATAAFAIGLKTNGASGNYLQCTYGQVVFTDYTNLLVSGSFVTNPGQPACATGDLVRITKTGTTIVVDKSSNGGASWTTLKTWTGVPDVDYFLGLFGDKTGSVNPQINNIRHVGFV